MPTCPAALGDLSHIIPIKVHVKTERLRGETHRFIFLTFIFLYLLLRLLLRCFLLFLLILLLGVTSKMASSSSRSVTNARYPSGGKSSHSTVPYLSSIPEKSCEHEVISSVYTSMTEQNPGRRFYRCPFRRVRNIDDDFKNVLHFLLFDNLCKIKKFQ